MAAPSPIASPAHLRIKLALLAVWAISSFGVCFFARDLDAVVSGWPFNYWFAAQGAMVVFIAIVVCYAWAVNAIERNAERSGTQSQDDTHGD